MKRVVSAIGVALALVAPRAHATEVDACAKAAEQGQVERRTDALLKAREHLIVCAAESCPSVIRADCARWLDEVEARLPAASVRVTDPSGRDVAARVTIDAALATEAPGRPIRLDPGTHVFRAEAPGFEPAEQRTNLAHADKARVVALVLKPKPRPAPALATKPAPPPQESESKPVSPFVVPLAVVGALGVASFAYFGLRGRSEADDLRAGCGQTSSCSQDAVDSAKDKYLVADISLTIGVTALGAAALIWLSRQ